MNRGVVVKFGIARRVQCEGTRSQIRLAKRGQTALREIGYRVQCLCSALTPLDSRLVLVTILIVRVRYIA